MSNAPFSLDPDDNPKSVEEINQEYKEVHTPEPPRPIGESSIDKLKKLSDNLGVSQIREDVDVMKGQITQIAESVQQLITANNNIMQHLNSQTTQTSQDPSSVSSDNFNKVENLAALAETFAGVWKQIKGEPQVQNTIPGFSPEDIQSRMVQGFLDDLETADSIRNAVKSSLVSKATGRVVKETLKSAINHEPE